MGKYYAQHDGEPPKSAQRSRNSTGRASRAIALPETRTGIALALADKLDTLAGIFAIGQKPTGTRDPFGLRRAALGVLRTILERQLDLDLRQLIESGGRRAAGGKGAGTVADEVWTLHRRAPAQLLPGRRRRHARSRPRCSTPCWRARRSRRSTSTCGCARSSVPHAAGSREPRGREQAHREHPAQGAGRSDRRGRYQPSAGRRRSASCSSTCSRWSAR